ncbi:Mu transposase C-terminal domain-containing protein [Campylobacter sp. RM9344]|uniref:Mu transposase C-terminal domain-containing protein n=1 Tax=Campylobacter californiensis TaxID=1032243 RepID=A0AAW3ZU50_9BACT|nr:Mu transposase C-terminal domain-containing protein [Campylobacter sp. RM9337]MBE3028855.1 Mu transposase C-terminal domain-containing protein [Campylobacter sp. RM9344]MBE3607213.1 Mu transposase C-terminal domain-containing protein [Campylobacter sp. RM9337]
MWVNSKEAAAILGVNLRKLQRCVVKAQNSCQKILTIDTKYFSYSYTDGIGRGGKVLQIWIDDENSNIKKENTNESGLSAMDSVVNTNSDSRTDSDGGVDARYDERFCLENVRDRELGGDKNVFVCAQDSKKLAVKNETKASINIKIKDLENMNKLKAVTELNACPKGMSKTLWGKGVADKYGVSLKTLYAWAKEQKIDEVQVSDDELSIDFKASFKSSSFEMSALEWAVGFMLHNPLSSKTFTYEQLEIYARKNNLKIGSYKSFARLIATPEIKAMLLRATAGDRGVRNEIASFLIRDLNCYESMELVCGDQIVFDFNAISPDGEVVNPNAYVWIDMGSGAIIGVDVVFGKYNRLSVGNSLKMALRFGVADAIYTDNGKPELSNYIEQVRSQLSGIKFKDFDDLAPNMRHKKAKPGNSRAKPIENIFNHVQRRMAEMIISECGGGVSYHKDKRENQEILKKYMKENPLDFEAFIAYFEKAVRWWNEHYNTSRKIRPMASFLEKLERKPKAVFDETTLDFIFSERRSIKVKNSSVSLSVMNERRTYSHPKLSKFNGESVEVRINEKDYEHVNIVDIDKHKLICEAALMDRVDPRDHAKVSAIIARNESVVRAVREAFSYYSNLYKRTNTITPYSGLAHETKVKNEKTRKINKKIAMSNEELLNAM